MDEWLNYHHLRYFWAVAREGGLRQAAEKLHVSQPSISAQIGELEAALGEKLFRRSGRNNVLTEAGQITLRYADEIFTLGRELAGAVKQRPGVKAIRLHVGIADSFPKLLTNEILRPAFSLAQTVHVVCREGKVEDLVTQLAAHRLDLVLADEPASSGTKVRTFNHRLGEAGVTFLAVPRLARTLRKGFPRSLHGAPTLLPAEGTGTRRSLEKWFQHAQIRPQVVAEFEDAALMKVVAADGKGCLPLPSTVADEAVARYGFEVIGTTWKCVDEFYAITAERRLQHPAVEAIVSAAQAAFA